MTETPTPAATPVAAPPSRRLRIALAVSVALNLAVAGLAGGAFLTHSGGGPRGEMVRDLGFGAFDEALTPGDRAILLDRFRKDLPNFRVERRQMQANMAQILTVLRADPFDPEALGAALRTQTENLAGRLETAQALLQDFLVSLTPEARAAFADRLEQRMLRGGGQGRDGDKPKG